jgi:nitrous oxide reductase accessory protein NosL
VLIDAQTAFWVIGGDLPGVMSMRATWAFKNQADAQKFIQQHGGDAASFEQALEAVYAHMYQDTKMIRKKRQMMKMKNQ